MDSEYLPVYVFGSVVFVLITIGTYNRFIKYRNIIEERWSGIDIALKRRFNLVPNLISAVKLYNEHEANIMQNTAQARHRATGVEERMQEESAITQSLQGLLAVAEAYPDLKASQNFLALQHSLADVENEIQQARSEFNSAVRMNNTLVQSFPSNIIAKIFRFDNAEYFSLELATERSLPEI